MDHNVSRFDRHCSLETLSSFAYRTESCALLILRFGADCLMLSESRDICYLVLNEELGSFEQPTFETALAEENLRVAQRHSTILRRNDN